MGDYNTSKIKTLIVLGRHRYNDEDNAGMSIKEISGLTGVSRGYLKYRMPLWVKWGYISRILSPKPPAHYHHRITEKGRRFIQERVPECISEHCASEIDALQRQNIYD